MDGGGYGLCEGTVGAVTSRDNLSQFYEYLSKSGYFLHTCYFYTNLFIALFMSVTADTFVFQLAFRELKPHPTADVDRRRDQKKKHKMS